MNEEEKREKEASTSLKVFVRVRPMGEDEAGIANAIFVGGDVSININLLYITLYIGGFNQSFQ